MVNSSQPQKPSLAGALATECAVAEAVEPAEKKDESGINVYH